MLLIVVFGKLCSSAYSPFLHPSSSLIGLRAARMDHEMSHIFQSSFVQLGRRSGLFSQKTVELPAEKRDDVEAQWHAWIEEEVAKRLAQIVFAIDVERTSLPQSSLSRSSLMFA